jgi:hypothetical protein
MSEKGWFKSEPHNFPCPKTDPHQNNVAQQHCLYDRNLNPFSVFPYLGLILFCLVFIFDIDTIPFQVLRQLHGRVDQLLLQAYKRDIVRQGRKFSTHKSRFRKTEKYIYYFYRYRNSRGLKNIEGLHSYTAKYGIQRRSPTFEKTEYFERRRRLINQQRQY